MLSLSITYNPAVLRVRSVQEGTFMRQGGIAATFTSQPDPGGRVDIVITRPGDQTGAVGTGLLAAILFEPVGAGHVERVDHRCRHSGRNRRIRGAAVCAGYGDGEVTEAPWQVQDRQDLRLGARGFGVGGNSPGRTTATPSSS